MSVAELEIPRTLPVDHLSVSSVNLFLRCPERWRRRYIEREYEPPSGAMLLGSSVGAAEGASYQEQIDSGERLATEDTIDLFADEWTERTGRQEVDWGEDKPDEFKDSGVACVKAYDTLVAPEVKPVSVERKFELELEHVDWGFQGFLDLEEEDGAVVDLKVRKRKLTAGSEDVKGDIQPTSYLLYKRAVGEPAPEFRYHTMVRTKQPYAEVVPTTRTDEQLDAFVERLYAVAAEINWRMENDIWQGAPPGAWWCSANFCGYFDSCTFAGLHRAG